jgi:hypothetical protein
MVVRGTMAGLYGEQSGFTWQYAAHDVVFNSQWVSVYAKARRLCTLPHYSLHAQHG